MTSASDSSTSTSYLSTDFSRWKPTQPSARPKITPPTASIRNSLPMPSTLAGAAPLAMPSRTMNTTTPTPSLNRDSPAILISSALGAPNCFSVASTAIGSVGEISAPNTRHQINGIGMPMRLNTSQAPNPTRAVDISTPTLASAPTTHWCSRSRARSTCSAPANSRKLSMPCNSASSKSMAAITCSTPSAQSMPNQRNPASPSDSTRLINITPSVVGIPSHR